MVALEQGESKNWQDLTQRLKYSLKSEIKARFESAAIMEQKGNFSGAEVAWGKMLSIPMDLLPPEIYRQALEFKNRRNINSVRLAKYKATNGTVLLASLFFCFSSWMIWFPLYKNQAFWEYLSVHVWGGFGLPMTPRQVIGFENAAIPALLQLFLFTVFMVITQSKLLHRPTDELRGYSALPRMLAFGAVAAVSPLSMVLYESYYHWVYVPKGLVFLVHPWLLVTAAWVGLDFLRGFDKKRIPANMALTISWLIASFLLAAKRFGEDVVPRTIMHPEESQLFTLTHWSNIAIFHMILYLVIIIVEHVIYKRKLGESLLVKRERGDEETMTDLDDIPTQID
jgi:hypothetical protein